jgi:hypothetical protein
MKKVVHALILFLLLMILPAAAIADSPDWALVQIPGSDGHASPVFFDTDTYLASDIATDINDNLYVMSGSRIIRFTPSGQLDVSWGNNGIIYDDFIMNSNCEQLDIVADSRGYVYALCRICEDGSPKFIKRYAPNGEADTTWYGDGVMGGKFYEYDDGTYPEYYMDDDETEPRGGIRNEDEIVLDSSDNLYVLYDREVYRFLPDGTPDKSWNKLKMEQPQYEYDEGGDGVWFDNALRIDWQDNIYIFNGFDQTVSKYDQNGELINQGKCGLYYPYEYYDDEIEYLINQVAFDADGNIYNNDYDDNIISKYSQEFNLISAWCGNGALLPVNYKDQLIYDFISDTKGNIYILDRENEVVSKYKSEGRVDTEWASKGSLGNVNGDGEPMLHVKEVIFDNDGSIYVVDQKDYEEPAFYRFDSKFEFMDGSTVKIDNNASSVIDCSGYLYVCVSEFNKVTRYTPEGVPDKNWGNGGEIIIPDSGGWDEYYDIYSIAVDDACNLYICNETSNRILRYDGSGMPDTSWCDNGEWRSADDMSDSPMPMINPTRVMIYNGRLYAVWNYKLYVMSDSAAQVGTKQEEIEPQASATAEPATIAPVEAASATFDPGTAVNSDIAEKNFDWWWVIGTGAVIFCLIAAFVIYLFIRKKR